jgi:hypothetical protein
VQGRNILSREAIHRSSLSHLPASSLVLIRCPLRGRPAVTRRAPTMLAFDASEEQALRGDEVKDAHPNE